MSDNPGRLRPHAEAATLASEALNAVALNSGVLNRVTLNLALLGFLMTAGLAAALTPADDLVDEVAQRHRLVADQAAAVALAKPECVGLVIAMATGGEVVVERGYGIADLEQQVPMRPDSVFRIGSVTKQFTAAAIMRLAEQGRVALDRPFAEYFADFPTPGREVTVRHLLTHSSGIKSYTGLGPRWIRTVPLELEHQELLALVQDEPFDFEPNQRFLYNNTGYYLLGVLIEAIVGKTYADWMSEQFFVPLGLSHTRYGFNEEIIPNRAEGYQYVNGAIRNDGLIGMSQPGAAGALVSTAGDLLRWQRALSEGRVVSPASFAEMITPHVLADGASTNYGFGLSRAAIADRPSVQHGGGINGFSSMLAAFPDDDLQIAVLSNSENCSAGAVVKELVEALFPTPTADGKTVNSGHFGHFGQGSGN